MAATHTKLFKLSGVLGSLRTAAQEDHKQEALIVIDFVSLSGSVTAAGTISIQVDDGANVMYSASTSIDATGTDTLYISFDGGFPCWKVLASGSDWISTPAHATVVQITPTVGDATDCNCIIGYHYERPSARRH